MPKNELKGNQRQPHVSFKKYWGEHKRFHQALVNSNTGRLKPRHIRRAIVKEWYHDDKHSADKAE